MNERTPLLVSSGDEIISNPLRDIEEEGDEDDDDQISLKSIIPVLLIGVFVSSADTSIVLATYGEISSEFHDLQAGGWLLLAFMISQCCAQPLYGKLSDIFGRRALLQTAYLIFTIGTLGSGVGQSMVQIIAARAIQGIGGAGMICMVTIVLTDLVPVHELALYRSYVNVVQTVGRSSGGALGGLLAQTIGWRWAFLGQCPFIFLAIFLVWKQLPSEQQSQTSTQSTWEKFCRIDIAGAALMSLGIASALIILDTGGQKVPWEHPLIILATVVAVTGFIGFVVVEKYWAEEPIFPLPLLTQYAVVNSFAIVGLQNLIQSALMFIVPVYWQVTKKATPAEAGLYLLPAIMGNTLGGLITGKLISKYYRYKFHIILASLNSIVCFISLILQWRGNSSVFQSTLIFSGGFGTGIAHSAVFVALANGVSEQDVAIAGSGFYLSGHLGSVIGVSAASATQNLVLRPGLKDALRGHENADKILQRTLEDINFIKGADDNLRDLLLPSYVASFQSVFYIGLVGAALAFIGALCVREVRLRHLKEQNNNSVE